MPAEKSHRQRWKTCFNTSGIQKQIKVGVNLGKFCQNDVGPRALQHSDWPPASLERFDRTTCE